MNALPYEVATILLTQVKREIEDHLQCWAATPGSGTFGRRHQEPISVRHLSQIQVGTVY
jgi:hypothetical protein